MRHGSAPVKELDSLLAWRDALRRSLRAGAVLLLRRVVNLVDRLTPDDASFRAEFLRPMDRVFNVDPRNRLFVTYDYTRRKFRSVELDRYHRSISELNLHAGVPESVVVQFEIAKNLYLYSWFVYRFYAVCEHQALTCLEFSLRERFGHEVPRRYFRGEKPTLSPLLRYAIDSKAVKNEGFRLWRERVQLRAQQRYQFDKLKEMREKGLDTIVLDYSQAVVEDADRDWDYLNVLLEVLPGIRNHYAHGTSSLHNQVRGTIELVAEIINQIFSNPAEGPRQPVS